MIQCDAKQPLQEKLKFRRYQHVRGSKPVLFYFLDDSYKTQSELSLEHSIVDRPCVLSITRKFYILSRLIPDELGKNDIFVDREISYTLQTSKLMIIAWSQISNSYDNVGRSKVRLILPL